jgi:ATP-binding protein involved in chromosome partitioning
VSDEEIFRMSSPEQLRQAVLATRIDDLGCTLGETAAEVEVGAGRVTVTLGFPSAGIAAAVQEQVGQVLRAAGSMTPVTVSTRIVAHLPQGELVAPDAIKNVIVVASGKGGVGKSTTAVNLALALAAEGARVGVLDADIHGPSMQRMLGVPPGQRPEVRDEQYIVPVPALGLQSMSMGFLVDENTPMVWRGPKVSGALLQMMEQTLWQDLDYLVVDMPPGTGDIQLTLAQRIPVAGAVIVTTPQDIALLDARKGIEMFRKTDIPVLGVVENMALHVCSNCGHVEHVFGAGGGERIARDYDTALLGSLPLALSIREQADGGLPTVAANPDGEIAAMYRRIARRTAARLAARPVARKRAFPRIFGGKDA